MNQEFKYLSDFLKKNNMSYAQAGKICGRTATAVRSWVYGSGINDKRVRYRISTIMGVTIAEVEAAVNAYNAMIQKQSKHLSSLTINEFCEQVKILFSVTSLYDDNRRIPFNTQTLMRKLTNNFCDNLNEIQKLDLK